jgi:hypothetical protein
MQGTTTPLVVAHSLSSAYQHFKAFELHSDADGLNEDLRVAGEESLREMKEISVDLPATPKEEKEKYFASLLSGRAEEVLGRIAFDFVPDREEIEKDLRKVAQQSPLSFMMTHAIMDHDGRTVAQIGPLDSDLEGNIVSHIGQNLRFSMGWLREAMSRLIADERFSPSGLADFVFASPVFRPERRIVVQNGLEAYFRGDSISAVHVLVPQVEEAIRQLATRIGAPIYTQRRGGGMHARILDEFLRDGSVVTALGESEALYLRTFLTDQRGWNVRNDLLHGLAPPGMMTMPVADRVVHVLLRLGCIRLRPKDGASNGTDTE